MEHKFVCTYISMLMFYIFLQSSEWVKPFRICEEFQHVYNSSYCQCSFKNEGDLLPPCVDKWTPGIVSSTKWSYHDGVHLSSIDNYEKGISIGRSHLCVFISSPKDFIICIFERGFCAAQSCNSSILPPVGIRQDVALAS